MDIKIDFPDTTQIVTKTPVNNAMGLSVLEDLLTLD